MKFKGFVFLMLMTFAGFLSGYSQVEPAEIPMFGNTKNINSEDELEPDESNLFHNFGVISGNAQTHKFIIKNTGQTKIDIIDIKLPAKVGITIIDLHILPGQEGIITATVDPMIMKKGPFKTWFIVTTQQKDPGIFITKEISFTVSGEIK